MSDHSALLLHLRNEFAENSILAAMIQDPGLAVSYAEILTVDHFAIPENKVTFLSICYLLLGTDPIDPYSIVAAGNTIMRDKKIKAPAFNQVYVAGLKVQFSLPENYLPVLDQMSWLRNMGEVAYWLVGEIQRAPNPSALFSDLQEKLKSIQPSGKSTANILYGWETSQFHINRIQAGMQAAQNGEFRLFDFPWDSWNAAIPALSGGMIGALYGPTKAGKSCYFDQIAEHWASKKDANVLLYHLEDSHAVKLARRSTRYSKVPYRHILENRLSQAEEQAIAEAEDEIQAGFGQRLHYVHAPGATASDACRTIKREVQSGFCQAVVIDYLNKFQASDRQVRLFGSNVWDRQADDVEQVKSLCEEMNIPCFTGGQEHKGGQDSTELDMSNVHGSGQIAHKVQMLAMFGRKRVGKEGMYDTNNRLIAKPGSLSPIIDFGVMAQNQEEAATWQQYIIGNRFKIIDLPNNVGTQRIELNEE